MSGMSTDRPPSGTGFDDLFLEGADWESLDDAVGESSITINMGPQHPSTHGVLRLILELEGEIVTRLTPVIGYLHTGIEKNAEYRTWVQGTTFFTRMDYLAPLFNETAYCLGVERLLGIEAPERAQAVRVILMEFNRIASHLVWAATGGMELGALTMMTMGFREREHILDLFESQSGLRMNHAYIRPGGLAQDVTDDFVERCEALLGLMPRKIHEYEDLLLRNPIWMERLQNVGVIDADTCQQMGVTGPLLRAAGVPWDLRKAQPYCGYEQYDFEVATDNAADSYARFLVRFEEMRQSLKIIRQALDTLPGGPVMVADKHIAWPSQQSLGADGIGNDPAYIRHIMGESMEALINHFKLVIEGVQPPPGRIYDAIETPNGELGFYIISDGSGRPYRIKVRPPCFYLMNTLKFLVEGGMVADIVAVLGGLNIIAGELDR
jgi:NADH-quinone oxidoreductase subunit D